MFTRGGCRGREGSAETNSGFHCENGGIRKEVVASVPVDVLLTLIFAYAMRSTISLSVDFGPRPVIRFWGFTGDSKDKTAHRLEFKQSNFTKITFELVVSNLSKLKKSLSPVNLN